MRALENKTAIVSGGLGDIGRAIAREFAALGANVAISGRRGPSAAEQELATLRQHGVRACYDSVDVADATSVQKWIDKVFRDPTADENDVSRHAPLDHAPCRTLGHVECAIQVDAQGTPCLVS